MLTETMLKRSKRGAALLAEVRAAEEAEGLASWRAAVEQLEAVRAAAAKKAPDARARADAAAEALRQAQEAVRAASRELAAAQAALATVSNDAEAPREVAAVRAAAPAALREFVVWLGERHERLTQDRHRAPPDGYLGARQVLEAVAHRADALLYKPISSGELSAQVAALRAEVEQAERGVHGPVRMLTL